MHTGLLNRYNESVRTAGGAYWAGDYACESVFGLIGQVTYKKQVIEKVIEKVISNRTNHTSE